MQFKTLEAWLDYIIALHPEKIELGLARVREVAERLNVLNMKCPVLTIAGTNGKGSTVAGLEAIYCAAGYKVGSFTSPYLFRHNEEVKISGVPASDETFCRAFARVEEARQDIQLTVFEFNTLAALIIFQESNLDVCLLEVGLGGRLDAVNIIDPDVAIVTSIAIDHTDWLGNTRELIGREKAGIFRQGHPVVCGDAEPPTSLVDYAAELNAPLYCRGRDFDYHKEEGHWKFQAGDVVYDHLPLLQLALQNMSTVIMTVQLMQTKLPVKPETIMTAMRDVQLTGRIQLLKGEVNRILDVSHNPASAQFLATAMAKHAFRGKKRAVFSMLADKDIASTIEIMKPWIDEWYIAELSAKRAASMDILQKAFARTEIKSVKAFDDIEMAYVTAMKDSQAEDCVIVFGSFYTLAGITSLRDF